MNYKDKIRKLLELAKSPNEHEAKAALLKARQLMAEHKLREADCVEAGKAKVRHATIGMTCTKRKEGWMPTLSSIIASNYCCASYYNRVKGAQKVTIGFIGFEDDFEICERVFRYAVDCVRAKEREYKRQYKKEWGDLYDGNYIRRLSDGYGCGFAAGVQKAFEEQSRENQEWGLVMVVPKEVKEDVGKLKVVRFAKDPDWDSMSNAENEAIANGYEDGKKFDPNRRLEAAV